MTDDKSIDHTWLFVILDLTILIITLYSLAILAEYFMIPSLQGISKKYKLSQQATGYILAFGACIPEFTTNLVSATSDDGNVNIGIGTITGSGSYDFTICFGIASLLTTVEGLKLNTMLYYRDTFIYLFTLSIITFFIKDNIVEFYEALILVLLCPLYLYISTSQNSYEEEKSDIKILFNSTLVDISSTSFSTENKDLSKLNISIVDDTVNYNSPFEFNSTIQGQSNIHNHSQLIGLQNETIINQDVKLDNEEEKANENYLTELKQEDEETLISNKNQDLELSKGKKDLGTCINTFLDKLNEWIVYFYSFIIPDPVNKSVLCFLFIILLTYLHTRVTLFLIENLSSLVKMTASFLGMTLLSWGGNVGDTINATVATKLKAADLLTTSILGSQVINLQLCLGLPWIISMLRKYFVKGESPVINFANRNPMKFLLPLFIVVLASIFIMTVFQTNLNKRSGICLIIVYIFYLAYEFNRNIE